MLDKPPIGFAFFSIFGGEPDSSRDELDYGGANAKKSAKPVRLEKPGETMPRPTGYRLRERVALLRR
jgi:hypothetical protein